MEYIARHERGELNHSLWLSLFMSLTHRTAQGPVAQSSQAQQQVAAAAAGPSGQPSVQPENRADRARRVWDIEYPESYVRVETQDTPALSEAQTVTDTAPPVQPHPSTAQTNEPLAEVIDAPVHAGPSREDATQAAEEMSAPSHRAVIQSGAGSSSQTGVQGPLFSTTHPANRAPPKKKTRRARTVSPSDEASKKSPQAKRLKTSSEGIADSGGPSNQPRALVSLRAETRQAATDQPANTRPTSAPAVIAGPFNAHTTATSHQQESEEESEEGHGPLDPYDEQSQPAAPRQHSALTLRFHQMRADTQAQPQPVQQQLGPSQTRQQPQPRRPRTLQRSPLSPTRLQALRQRRGHNGPLAPIIPPANIGFQGGHSRARQDAGGASRRFALLPAPMIYPARPHAPWDYRRPAPWPPVTPPAPMYPEGDMADVGYSLGHAGQPPIDARYNFHNFPAQPHMVSQRQPGFHDPIEPYANGYQNQNGGAFANQAEFAYYNQAPQYQNNVQHHTQQHGFVLRPSPGPQQRVHYPNQFGGQNHGYPALYAQQSQQQGFVYPAQYPQGGLPEVPRAYYRAEVSEEDRRTIDTMKEEMDRQARHLAAVRQNDRRTIDAMIEEMGPPVGPQLPRLANVNPHDRMVINAIHMRTGQPQLPLLAAVSQGDRRVINAMHQNMDERIDPLLLNPAQHPIAARRIQSGGDDSSMKDELEDVAGR